MNRKKAGKRPEKAGLLPMSETLFPLHIEVDESGTPWVSFSSLLAAAGIGDAKSAGEKCDRENPALERRPLPGLDQRRIFIRCADVAAFFRRYRRPTPEQSGAFIRVLQEIRRQFPGQVPEDLTGKSGLFEVPRPEIGPDNTPDNAGAPIKPPPRNPAIRPQQPRPESRRNPANSPDNWWDRIGKTWGDLYASALLVYLALTGIVLAQAVLHGLAFGTRVPKMPLGVVLFLSLLIQSVILVGTVHSRFFQRGGQYGVFLAGFAVYDLVMCASNFFTGYDPTTLLDAGASWPVKIAAVCDLGIRMGFTVGFPLGTVFFASLVKRLHN